MYIHDKLISCYWKLYSKTEQFIYYMLN